MPFKKVLTVGFSSAIVHCRYLANVLREQKQITFSLMVSSGYMGLLGGSVQHKTIHMKRLASWESVRK